MPLASLPKTITPGTPENASDVQSNDAALLAALNGQLDGDNLTAAAARAAGISDSTNIRRGSSIIATSESITSGAYATLTTPDRVSNIVVPASGIMYISFWAQITKAVGTAGDTIQLALFLGATQTQDATGNNVLFGQYGAGIAAGGAATVMTGVTTTSAISGAHPNYCVLGPAVTGDVTTGHEVGLFIPFSVAAGTYTVEMRWLRSGTAAFTAATRRLYVEAKSF